MKEHPKNTGILDLFPFKSSNVPLITESETIEAMSNLKLAINDITPLGFNPIPMLDDNPALRMRINIELEKKRLDNIEKIICERSRIIEKNQFHPTKIRKEPISAVSSSIMRQSYIPKHILNPKNISALHTTKEMLSYKIQKATRTTELERMKVIEEIKRKARMRLEAIKKEESILKSHKDEMKAKIISEHKKIQERWNKHQENKKSILMNEMKSRQIHIYNKPTSRKKLSQEEFRDLRIKLLANTSRKTDDFSFFPTSIPKEKMI